MILVLAAAHSRLLPRNSYAETKPPCVREAFVSLMVVTARDKTTEGCASKLQTEGEIMAQYSVVIVDDDEKIVRLLKAYFEKESFAVFTAYDGLAALTAVKEHAPDIVVLDLMLPELDGWEVCRRLRQESEVAILMLTARDEESDRLVGLELGADDYVAKPFSPREVVARAKAILRRVGRAINKADILRFGLLEIDSLRHQVVFNGNVVELTPTEFKILELLAKKPGQVFSRLQIVDAVQGYAFEGFERTIDAHVKNLRRKIGDNPKEPRYIQTVYGIGYKFGGEYE